MRIAIIGGRLQGTEAAYLAKKAGMKSLLIDKKENILASGLSDEVAVFDVRKKEPALIELLKTADFILPCLENQEVHAALKELAEELGLNLAFDFSAYEISSSKLKSDRLMEESGVPVPLHYPRGKSPYIVKPSGESGSEGVRKLETEKDLRDFMEGTGATGEWVMQEFLEGPSYSIEVIGAPGNYRTYTITQIHMDSEYDCCRVTAPCPITEKQRIGFEEIGCRLAEMVKLHGIMDVEVIDDNGVFKVLEIDARIPSQTPTVVYHASGMNLLQEMADIVTNKNFKNPRQDREKVCSYEHFRVEKTGFVPGGEHIMCDAGPLKLMPGFFGADEALSDYSPEKDVWYGTFIHWADTEKILTEKRDRLIRRLENFTAASRLESEVMG